MDYSAVIFVPALAGCVMVGFVFALFAAHFYLTVLQSAAAGARLVTWASEPILDHFWKMFYLAWLIGLWLGPAWFLGRAYAGGSAAVWVKFAVPLAFFWICYPVSQLSSLGGPTIWLPLHPGVFERLGRKPAATIGFLLFSGATLAGFGLGFYWVFIAPGTVWLFVGSPVLVLGWLMYARLIGRLAFALSYAKTFLGCRRKAKRFAHRDRTSDGVPGSLEGQYVDPGETPSTVTEFVQPSDLPPIETPDEGPLSGYDVQFDEKPAKRRKRVVAEMADEPVDDDEITPHVPPVRGGTSDEDDDIAAYGIDAAEVQPVERLPRSVVQPREDEMRLLNRDDAPKPPKRVWTAQVLAFLGQPETLTAWLMLSALCFATGGMVRIAKAFNPVGSGSGN